MLTDEQQAEVNAVSLIHADALVRAQGDKSVACSILAHTVREEQKRAEAFSTQTSAWAYEAGRNKHDADFWKGQFDNAKREIERVRDELRAYAGPLVEGNIRRG